MTDNRRPHHLAIFLGLSAGAYAATLAGVAALQAGSDAAVAARLAPAGQAIDDVAARHDALERAVREASSAYEQAAGAYQRLGADIAATENELRGLSSTVGAVRGASDALPARVALPPVVRSVGTLSRTTTATTPHATTGASGVP